MEVIADGDFIYIVSARMNQGDLYSNMKKLHCAYLTEQELRSPFKNILSALKTIHKHGYIHNDIQPSNILLHRHKKNNRLRSVKLGGFTNATR